MTLPYAMLLTRLFKHVQTNHPYPLPGEFYLVDHVMIPLSSKRVYRFKNKGKRPRLPTPTPSNSSGSSQSPPIRNSTNPCGDPINTTLYDPNCYMNQPCKLKEENPRNSSKPRGCSSVSSISSARKSKDSSSGTPVGASLPPSRVVAKGTGQPTHKKVDRVLHEIVPQLAERDTDDLIENNLKPSIAATIIEDYDAFRLEVPDLSILPQTTSTKTTSSTDLQQQLYLKMKRSLQDQANDPVLWEKRVKRHKASKSSKSARGSLSKHSAKDFTTYVSKQQQQQEWDAWVEETIIDEDEVILEDETPELIIELQNVDKHVPTIFDRARMEATLNDMLRNQFKNAEEYAYHLEQATNFMENVGPKNYVKHEYFKK
ncbi:hypothetical protein Tco_1386036 [Tanacetum coccineum]